MSSFLDIFAVKAVNVLNRNLCVMEFLIARINQMKMNIFVLQVKQLFASYLNMIDSSLLLIRDPTCDHNHTYMLAILFDYGLVYSKILRVEDKQRYLALAFLYCGLPKNVS